jgi:hypothetical protein
MDQEKHARTGAQEQQSDVQDELLINEGASPCLVDADRTIKVEEDVYDQEKALADRSGKGSGTERWPRAVPFDSTPRQHPLSNRAERG